MKSYKKATRFQLVIPEYLKLEIEKLANDRSISMSQVVNDAIKAYLQNQKQKADTD